MARGLTRRTLMASGAALAAVAAGGAWLSFKGTESALLAYLREKLPGVAFDENSARICIAQSLQKWSFVEQRVAGVAYGVVGVDRLAPLDERFELMARRVLTRFLTESNFFDVADPKAEVIAFQPQPPQSACASRFSDFGESV